MTDHNADDRFKLIITYIVFLLICFDIFVGGIIISPASVERIVVDNMGAITPEEFTEHMLELEQKYGDDEEEVHIKMDDYMLEILRSLGYGEGCDIFDRTHKWCS